MTLKEFRLPIPINEEISIHAIPSPYLSVIIPAKNEESRLSCTLIQLSRTIGALGFDYEAIVVDDGSIDRTAHIAHLLGAKVITNKKSQGIAAAFRAGAGKSRGEVVMLCPADIKDFGFLKFAISASKAYDVVSVSKRHPKSIVLGYGKWRWLMSNYYHRLVSLIFGKFGECTDTHYIKLYDGIMLRWIIKRCIINGPVGETEIMIRARNLGCSFFEVPARILHNNHGSKTNPRMIIKTAKELIYLWTQKP